MKSTLNCFYPKITKVNLHWNWIQKYTKKLKKIHTKTKTNFTKGTNNSILCHCEDWGLSSFSACFFFDRLASTDVSSGSSISLCWPFTRAWASLIFSRKECKHKSICFLRLRVPFSLLIGNLMSTANWQRTRCHFMMPDWSFQSAGFAELYIGKILNKLIWTQSIICW